MDWNGNLRPFVPRAETSFNFLYNYVYDQYPGMEVKQSAIAEAAANGLVPAMDKMSYGGSQEKKKRLTNEQLESLERSFQEEIKLDPDRKMKLSRELGLQPRQIAVWFQNRRARWKAKQLERLYDALKLEYDTVSKEKQKLQEEVVKLKAVLREQVGSRKQASTGYTDISADQETVESTSVAAIRSTNVGARGSSSTVSHQIAECNNLLLSVDDQYHRVPSPYWALLPSYPA
ncbi:hypothetical protein Tsubulata_013406 [Turnera subulata]|uniref:Homeobox-leucine zipper protein n=1 Tax=Turnera subulata TaxID=218843 RepID=A0A9Q0J286_9ROSI|nr:hypothetical protein Tsubulata_013406 [Turnera subulata]